MDTSNPIASVTGTQNGERSQPEPKVNNFDHHRPQVHRMINSLALAALGDGFINALMSEMGNQMQNGYRLAFPMFSGRDAGLLRCIALLTTASEPRLRAVRDLQIVPGATHVFLLSAYDSEAEWLWHASRIATIFPEQPDAPMICIGEIG
jgi:hypothetical protein